MFNLYANIKAQRLGEPIAEKEPDVTGHDRFCQEHPSRRRRSRSRRMSRRTLSAVELNSRMVVSDTRRSDSFEAAADEDDDAGADRSPFASKKFYSVIRLFPCATVASAGKASKTSTASASACKSNGSHQKLSGHGGRYEYTALEADACSHERLELERQARERAHSACQNYLKSCPRYTLIHHLNDIGSRVDKHWFVVRDASIKTERLLTLVPRSSACPIQCNSSTRTTILELFLALQHPYIYPVLDLEFRDTSSQMYAILVLPFNDKGSLKDLIYKSRWQDDWGQKYGQRSAGLPISQIQRLGRQILEALLFLKERGFPPCAHLHSGNIILQNGVARLTGLENTLLGYTSRIHPVIWSRARSEPNSIDSICFGHVLFEMCAGYELCAPQPSPTHLLDVSDYQPVIEVLDLIFQHPEKRFPSVEELLFNDFFRNIDLREMRATPLPQAFQPRLTASTLGLLSEIKRFQISRRARRAQAAAAAATAETSSPHRERRFNQRTASAVSRKVRLRCQVCPEANSFAEFERQWETEV